MARFTTSDGLSLHFTDTGQGVPILCLAGLTRTGEDFAYVTPHLDGARVLTMDYRGRGRSDWAPDPSSYTPAREAQDVVELLDHLGLPQVAILGSSRGGLVAMVLAATAKDRLTGVALNDVGPELEPEGVAAISGYLGRDPDWRTLDEAAQARPAAMPGFRGVPEARWRQEVARLYRETPEGLRITYDPKLREAVLPDPPPPPVDLWPLFDALEGLPLALIRGANSDLLSAATAQKMQERRPDMILAEVADRGHIPFLDEPEALAALRDWMGRLP
ncbi:alpha/beta fold hydrolase [Aquicoccus sp. SCR17]|nr:alpha/beta fold hydrolase [Carideicomes alvinocaridis]